MDFSNFFNPYIFDVDESVFLSFTQLFFSCNLENLGRLPVLQELEGTDDWILRILVIFSFPTFARSRNLFLAVSQSYLFWVISKIQVNFRFREYSRVLSIGSYGFQ